MHYIPDQPIPAVTTLRAPQFRLNQAATRRQALERAARHATIAVLVICCAILAYFTLHIGFGLVSDKTAATVRQSIEWGAM